MKKTVIQYVLDRLKEEGIADVFGVPGDFAFPINDAVCKDSDLRWIGCCNELNASYAADGYARIKGLAALSTTYGVGELSALCGIAGAYAENVPIFHIVGMPNSKTQQEQRIVHHTLGDGVYDHFVKMAAPAACAHAILTPDNIVSEMERVIHAALAEKRPVYVAIASDHAEAEITIPTDSPVQASLQSDPKQLVQVMAALKEELGNAQSAVVLAGVLLRRLGLVSMVQEWVEAKGIPYATMFMDKTALDESTPGYIGMYDGKIGNTEVRQFVESCDVVLNLGGLWSDLNTGAFTANIQSSRRIDIMQHHVVIGQTAYENIEMADVLDALAEFDIPRVSSSPEPKGLSAPQSSQDTSIGMDYLYSKWESFLHSEDILIAETGTASLGMSTALMPSNSLFLNQSLWASIGWATPAAFGAALASPDRRIILITGEGAHQLTAQEIGQFYRYGLKPVIFCINNQGYLIERLLCKEPELAYNDLADWNYCKLPEALGCKDWFSARVSTNNELDEAMRQAETNGTGAYIEVVTDRNAAPPVAMALHQFITTLYGK